MILGCAAPAPNTVCVPVRHKLQALQFLAACRNSSSVAFIGISGLGLSTRLATPFRCLRVQPRFAGKLNRNCVPVIKAEAALLRFWCFCEFVALRAIVEKYLLTMLLKDPFRYAHLKCFESVGRHPQNLWIIGEQFSSGVAFSA